MIHNIENAPFRTKFEGDIGAMEKHQVQWLIHGHTHRPAVHELIANQQPAFRVVLGAWHTEGSMVKVTADDVELIHFPF